MPASKLNIPPTHVWEMWWIFTFFEKVICQWPVYHLSLLMYEWYEETWILFIFSYLNSFTYISGLTKEKQLFKVYQWNFFIPVGNIIDQKMRH